MNLGGDWKVSGLDCPDLFVGSLGQFDAIRADVYFESTQPDGLGIDGTDPIGQMLCEVVVHAANSLFDLDDGRSPAFLRAFIVLKKRRNGVLKMIVKFGYVGGCLLGSLAFILPHFCHS